MTFEEAMNTECPECRTPAKIHRLTRTGRLYCLVLTESAQKNILGSQLRHVSLHHIPVKNLVRSPLPIEVGAVIDYELNSAANAGIRPF